MDNVLTTYRILFVDDMGSGNTWNIGVIANDGQKAHLRILGAKSRHDIEHTPLTYLTGIQLESWAYREWVCWFYDVAENEGVNPAGLHKVMNRLIANGTTITVEPGESVPVPDGQDPASVVDRLFASLMD